MTTPQSVHLPQDAETEVSFAGAPHANLRYAYYRSSDSVANQIEGQDYLAFRQDERRLTFVVCDGVGSSFCGNIAAKVLGEAMLAWLWKLDTARLTSTAALTETARNTLNKIRPQAEREVSRYEVPEHLPPLVQQALEGQRAYGSETVFVAGRLDHPSDGSPEGRLLLVWMGDTQFILYDDAGDEIGINASFSANDRWSSVQGVRGDVHTWVGEAEPVARWLVFSDGISDHAERLAAYSDVELEEAAHAQFRADNSDDIALLDIVRHTPAYLGLADRDRPTDASIGTPILNPFNKDPRDSSYEVSWVWNNGKAKFALQEATNPAFRDAYTEEVGGATAWQTQEPRPPGRYYYRVRALTGRKGVAGPWSAPQVAQVAYPPPEAPAIQPVGTVEGAYVVQWDEVAHSQEYVLEEAASGDFSDAVVVYRGRGTDWYAGSDRQPRKYHYRVQAVNDGGSSAWSATEVVEVTVPPPPVPALAHIRPVLPGEFITLSWSGVAQATRYEVHEIDEATGEERTFDTADTRLTLDARPAGRYTYQVRACHEHACSEWSAAQTVEVLPEAPEAAPELQVEGPDTDNILHFAWTAVEGAARYVLEEADTPDFRRAMPMSMGERNEHTLLRREPGRYFYRLRGENVSGYGPWSAPVEVLVRPGTPAWIEVDLPEVDKPRVEVTWDVVPGQVTYQLELMAGDPDADVDTWSQRRQVYEGREPACALRLPEDLRTFALRVRATHADAEGEWQLSQVISRVGPPKTPRLDAPEFQKDGDVLIRWEAVDEATHYEIEHARDESFANARRYETDRIRFRFKPGGERSWFRVQACNEYGCSDPSDPVNVVLNRIAAPELLPLETASPGGSVRIAWTEVGDALHYEIQRASDEAFKDVERHLVDAPAQEWTLPPAPGRAYVRVQAVGADGRVSDWSDVLVINLNESGMSDA